MPSVNRVILIGNLTRDPQTKQLPGGSGASVCEFGLAMNRRFRTQAGEEREEVCFIDCAAFGKTGEVIQQYCTRGKPLFVEGRLRYDTWDDKSGGGKRTKLSVIVENFQFLGSRQDEAGATPTSSNYPGQAREDVSGAAKTNSGTGAGGNDQQRQVRRARPEKAKQIAIAFDDKPRFKEADIPF
jgi:single-strand DNA-binding protein